MPPIDRFGGSAHVRTCDETGCAVLRVVRRPSGRNPFLNGLPAGRAGVDAAHSQQGITTSSQQSPSQQGEAAKAAVDRSAKARTVKSFFMSVLEMG